MQRVETSSHLVRDRRGFAIVLYNLVLDTNAQNYYHISPHETGLPPGMGFRIRLAWFCHPLMYSIGPIKDQQSVAWTYHLLVCYNLNNLALNVEYLASVFLCLVAMLVVISKLTSWLLLLMTNCCWRIDAVDELMISLLALPLFPSRFNLCHVSRALACD